MKKLITIGIALLIVLTWATVIYRELLIPDKYAEAIVKVNQACSEKYYVEAQQLLEAAKEINGNAETYETDVLQKNIYLGLGKENMYVSSMKSLIQTYPDMVENYEELASYYYENGKFKELCACIDDYVELWPDDAVINQVSNNFGCKTHSYHKGYYDVRFIDESLVAVQEKEFENDEEDNQFVNLTIVSSEGSPVLDGNYKDASISVDGNSFFVSDQQGNWKLINQENNLLAQNDEYDFEWIGRMGKEGIAPGIVNGEYHFVNNKMKVNETVWDEMSAFNDGVAAVCRDNHWGFITSDTIVTISELPYKDIAINDKGFCSINKKAVVSDNEGYFIINLEDYSQVGEKKYESMKAFNSKQPAAFCDGGLWGFITAYGDVYIEAQYQNARSYINGYAAIEKDGLWGFIDKNNMMVVEPQFTEVTDVLDNGYIYYRNEDERWDLLVLDKLFYAE